MILKIGFRFDVGGSNGMGHFTRCLAVASAFKSMGHQIIFFCFENEVIRKWTSENKINFIAISPQTLNNEMAFIKERSACCDILFLDSYNLSSEYISYLNTNRNQLLCCFDDDALYNYNCDVLINPHPHSEEMNFVFYGKPSGMLLGGKYWPLRKEFETSKRIEIEKVVKSVLIIMGGGDVNRYTGLVANIVDKFNIRVDIILGPLVDDDYFREVKNNISEKMLIHKNPVNLIDIISSCDFAVCSGGNIIYELSIVGMPIISIPQSKNEMIKVEYLYKNGYLLCPFPFNKYNSTVLESCIKKFLNEYNIRKEYSNKAKHIISRHGCLNIVNEIQQQYKELIDREVI